jgi:two-component system, chemotaxis family, sensor kinase CheA
VDTSRYSQLFLTESREQLSEINSALLALEGGGGEAAVARLFRAVHSMKGMSAAMGFTSVSDLSHQLETLFDKIRSGALRINAAIMDILFAGADTLEQAVNLATATPSQQLDVTPVMARIRAVSNEEATQTFTSEFAIIAKEKTQPAPRIEKGQRHVRIDARRLDTLMNVMGELVIARDRVARIADTLGNEALTEAVSQSSQIATTLQNEIMSIRMVPVWQVFDRFPRLVRDTARSLGKNVEFKIEGKEIELDRSMLDEMGEPVLHLLRNALDHGIESPEERAAAGKSETAHLTLVAERDRATVVIHVVDDGRGIDASRILPRAKQMGLIDKSATGISQEEMIRIISLPGFSTAEKVTDISGRGVGFDIVANKIRLLGGSLDVHTESGEGTTVSMRLPLTLAISRALLARVDNEIYAIPLTHVIETLSLSQPMLQESKGREVLSIRDDIFPAIRLRERVGLPPSTTGTGQIVLIELAERKAALIVDEFMGQQEIVVKQFDSVDGCRALFSGATILGDGNPALIVDASTLL